MMQHYALADEFGRTTVFTGEKLVSETTDIGYKPKWLEVDVYRTEAGNWVVQRANRFRIRHVHNRCSRADGYALAPARSTDTYPCRECAADAPLVTGHVGFAQLPRISVDSYSSVEALIASFRAQDGVYSGLSRAVLADLSDQDERVDAAWNTVVVP